MNTLRSFLHKESKGTIKLYDLVFTIWAIYLMPITLIPIFVINYFIDLAVFYLSIKKTNLILSKKDIYGKTAIMCVIGCVCDVLSALFYCSSTMFLGMGFHIVIDPTNPYSNIPSFILMIITLLLASILIYTFDYLYLSKSQKLDKKIARHIALMFVVFTAPYLFLVPMHL